jgi:hypothetical protein
MSDIENTPGLKKRLGHPRVAHREWKRICESDPRAATRETLLRTFYQYPHATTAEEREGAILRDPSRANHGLLNFEVEAKKTKLLDAVYERPVAARITYAAADEEVAERRRQGEDRGVQKPRSRAEISTILSEAFQTFVMDPWDEFAYDKELQIQDVLLFSTGVGIFDNGTVYPRYIPMETVKPNIGAGYWPDKWEFFFVIEEFRASDLWDKANKDSGWDKKAILRAMKRTNQFSQWARSMATAEGWLKLELNGEFQSQLECVELDLLALYVKEWDGSISKRYLDPEGDGKCDWLWEKANYAKSFGEIIVLHVDTLGHGKFYGIPSFAQRLFFQCVSHDHLMNAAIDAARVNSMAIFERRGESSRPVRAFRDNVILEPGTTPVQQRFELPVAESANLAMGLMSGVRAAAGQYQQGDASRDTAYEARADLMSTDKKANVTMNRWNWSQTFELREIYRRLMVNGDVRGKEPYDIAKKGFIEFCKAKGLKEKHWAFENVKIRSMQSIGAGEPALRLERSTRTLQILRVKPNSPGEWNAQRDAVAALNGIANVDDYMGEERIFPDVHTRVIGNENESMKDANFNGANSPVLSQDPHILHLMGDVQDGGQTLGHLPECAEEVQLGLQMMESMSQVPPSDQPIVADKINSQIAYVANFIEHSVQHLKFLAGDPDVKASYEEAQNILAQIIRLRDELVANFKRLQQARFQQATKELGEDPEAAKHQIAIQREKAIADIQVASRVEEAQARVDIIRQEGQARIERTKAEAAAKLSSSMAQQASKIESEGGEKE